MQMASVKNFLHENVINIIAELQKTMADKNIGSNPNAIIGCSLAIQSLAGNIGHKGIQSFIQNMIETSGSLKGLSSLHMTQYKEGLFFIINVRFT